MPDFTRRSQELEIMDDLECSGSVVNQTLRELEFINTWLGGNGVTTKGVQELLRKADSNREIVIVDLGCGGGDMLALIYRWSRTRGLKLKLIGIDANPHIVSFARKNIDYLPEIEFLTVDIFSEEFRQMRFDVALGTLFYHHFTDEQLTNFFRQLKQQARLGFVINDIHRHPLAYHSIRLLTRLFSRSDMVKYDAPLSVLRAFTRTELLQILKAASVAQFRMRWKWAFRWQVVVFCQ